VFTALFRQLLRGMFPRDAGPRRNAESYLDEGKALSDAGRNSEAIAAYGRAIALKPDCSEAHYRLGLAWGDRHEFENSVASYQRALALRPDYIEAHNNLGTALQHQGKLSEALASYHRAVDLNPDFSQPYLNLGRLCGTLGDQRGAAQSYRHAIEGGVDQDAFGHLLNAAEGVPSERAHAAYSRTVFDNFAADFDHRLVDELGYRIPQILGAHAKALLARPDLRVLDIGCGTGLCGLHIMDACEHLVGVDLSPEMLAKARARNIYHELIEGDAVAYLDSAPAAAFDAVLAADVFIYIGELADVFVKIGRVLKIGGVFAFSIELAPAHQSFVLQENEHFAQSMQYIRRIAAESGLVEAEAFAQTIRGERGTVDDGCVFVMRKRGA